MALHPKIAVLIKCALSPHYIAKARKYAKQKYPDFPHNGCAAFASTMLRLCHIDVPFTVNAEQLATYLKDRLWRRIPVGQQIAGDVGVTMDQNNNNMADHIYVVGATQGRDLMTIADNQSTVPHSRYASGRGKGPTEYFLRGGNWPEETAMVDADDEMPEDPDDE